MPTYRLGIEPGEHDPGSVKAIRKSLAMGRAVFARFLGVTPAAISNREQGVRVPSGLARRFLDELAADPSYWRGRLARMAAATIADPVDSA